MPAELVPVLVVFVVIGLPILSGTIIALAKIIKGGDRSSKKAATTEEAQMIQEIHQGLSRLERRIEAIETITLERHGKPSTHSRK